MFEIDEIVLFGAAVTAIKFTLMYMGWNKRPKHAELVGRVTRLTLYPVKSLAGVDVEQAVCTYMGFQLPGTDIQDRSWVVVVGEENRFVTARQEPAMLLIKPTINDDNTISFDAPSMETLHITLFPYPGKSTIARVWGAELESWDCGDVAAEWISRYLGDKARHRLMFCNSQKSELRSAEYALRKVKLGLEDIQEKDKLIYQDGAAYLLTTESSFIELNKQLSSNDEVHVEAFRPSIVVSGNNIPFEEDNWREIFIGDKAKFTTTMPCPRCILTTIDPTNAVKRPDNEPLNTLKRMSRRLLKGSESPCFGNFLVCDRLGSIRVGDPVYVIRRQ